ncbi:hypothetical protein OF83DRAFT_1178355, partial [Amylostereum chailletii]
ELDARFPPAVKAGAAALAGAGASYVTGQILSRQESSIILPSGLTLDELIPALQLLQTLGTYSSSDVE